MTNVIKTTYKKKHLKYQKTEHWKSLKKQCLNYFGNMCCLCGKEDYRQQTHKTLIMHHLNYKNPFNENIGIDVIIMCNTCHYKINIKTINLFNKQYYRYNRNYPPLKQSITDKEKLKRLKLSETIRKNRHGGKTITDPRYNETNLIKPVPMAE